MGCGSCGTSKPGGCQSNGGCSTGGCNRLNVHDWLLNLPFSDPESSCKIVEVSFKQGSRKEYFRNATLQFFEKGDYSWTTQVHLIWLSHCLGIFHSILLISLGVMVTDQVTPG